MVPFSGRTLPIPQATGYICPAPRCLKPSAIRHVPKPDMRQSTAAVHSGKRMASAESFTQAKGNNS